MHESRIYYNVSEANALVPRLEFLFAELARIQQQVNHLHVRAAGLGIDLSGDIDTFKTSGNPVKRQLHERLTAISEEYADRLDEVHDLGVIVDDLEQGIVNFYSWLNGGEVFLSWQYGEPEVGHWHTVKEAASTRRPLKVLRSANLDEQMIH